MSCNAHNHSYFCDCGFGGATRGADPGPLPPWLSELRWRPDDKQLTHSYTIPNCSCPICGEPVFFHQAKNGGRVYFDELGPPWPKHPCTDHPAPRMPWRAANSLTPPRRAWATKGWVPVLKASAGEGAAATLITVTTVLFRGRSEEFLACSNQILPLADHGPAFWRQGPRPGKAELAWLADLDDGFAPKKAVLDLHAASLSRERTLLERALIGEAAAQTIIGLCLGPLRTEQCSDPPLVEAAWRFLASAMRGGEPYAALCMGNMVLKGLVASGTDLSIFDGYADRSPPSDAAKLAIASCWSQITDMDMATVLERVAAATSSSAVDEQ